MFITDVYCLKNEEWRDIPGYEKLYQASNLGRVRSVDGKITETDRHGKRVWKGRVLKNRTKAPAKNGYRVSLWKDGKNKDWLVHRLIAMAFLGIPEGIEIKSTGKRMTVNHKDGDRFNNKIENLEWLTIENNIKHAFDNDLMPTCKKVILLRNEEKFEFRSMSKASEFLGRNNGYLSGALMRGNRILDESGNEYKVLQEQP